MGAKQHGLTPTSLRGAATSGAPKERASLLRAARRPSEGEPRAATNVVDLPDLERWLCQIQRGEFANQAAVEFPVADAACAGSSTALRVRAWGLLGNMVLFKTTTCDRVGHPEFTVQFRSPPTDGSERLLLGYFEEAVARGTRFGAGHTIGMGGHTLRLISRSDRTLGVEEPVPSPRREWIEAVDRTVRELTAQQFVSGRLGLPLAFPPRDSVCLASECARRSERLVLSRVAPPESLLGFSGWVLRCPEEHEHGDHSEVPLLALSAVKPFAVQFLALPTGSVVVLIPGRAHVFHEGKELTPPAGLHLNQLAWP